MAKYLELRLTDTLSFWDDYLEDYVFNPENKKDFVTWYRLPDDWVTDNPLQGDKLEALLKHIYGENWRLGNGDGSRYQPLDIKVNILLHEESAQKPWLNEQRPCYIISDTGSIEKCQPQEF
jgi:hypothetical protein